MSEKRPEENSNSPSTPSNDTAESAKRRRTDSLTIQSPSASWMTSTADFVFTSFEELMSAAKGLDNMALAHEISINDSFRLEKATPADNSLEKVVSEVLHKAFWDILKQQLESDPPCYEYALKLLEEVKTELKSLLLPQHTRLSVEIDEHLDLQLARQKANTGSLEFRSYANYVITVMEGLCAPVRDENIRNLKQIDDVIPMFKEIFAVLDLMKLDMANFAISTFRPVIAARSVEYERQQFQKYLDATPNGLRSTECWLQTSFEEEFQRDSAGASTAKVLSAALWNIIESDWEDSTYPETLLIDKKRLDDLSHRFLHVITTASAVLITCSCAGSHVADHDAFKQLLKEKLLILLEGCTQQNISDRLDNLFEQICHEYQIAAEQHDWPKLSESKLSQLRSQLFQLKETTQPVRNLVRMRIRQFIIDLLTLQSNQVQMPPGLGIVAPEIKESAGRFCRIVIHNREVFKDIYSRIIDELLVEKRSLTIPVSST